MRSTSSNLLFSFSIHYMWSTSLSDNETLKLMSTPRCSLPDIVGNEDMLRRKRRRKRYALSGLKWHKTDLTWRCVSCHACYIVALSHPCMNHQALCIIHNCVKNDSRYIGCQTRFELYPKYVWFWCQQRIKYLNRGRFLGKRTVFCSFYPKSHNLINTYLHNRH